MSADKSTAPEWMLDILRDVEIKHMVAVGKCPACADGKLDTGWECLDCGEDCMEIAMSMPKDEYDKLSAGAHPMTPMAAEAIGYLWNDLKEVSEENE